MYIYLSCACRYSACLHFSSQAIFESYRQQPCLFWKRCLHNMQYHKYIHKRFISHFHCKHVHNVHINSGNLHLIVRCLSDALNDVVHKGWRKVLLDIKTPPFLYFTFFRDIRLVEHNQLPKHQTIVSMKRADFYLPPIGIFIDTLSQPRKRLFDNGNAFSV